MSDAAAIKGFLSKHEPALAGQSKAARLYAHCTELSGEDETGRGQLAVVFADHTEDLIDTTWEDVRIAVEDHNRARAVTIPATPSRG